MNKFTSEQAALEIDFVNYSNHAYVALTKRDKALGASIDSKNIEYTKTDLELVEAQTNGQLDKLPGLEDQLAKLQVQLDKLLGDRKEVETQLSVVTRPTKELTELALLHNLPTLQRAWEIHLIRLAPRLAAPSGVEGTGATPPGGASVGVAVGSGIEGVPATVATPSEIRGGAPITKGAAYVDLPPPKR